MNLRLTRAQLASFLQNHEQVKQFERLFNLVDENLANGDAQGAALSASNALAAAASALAGIEAILAALDREPLSADVSEIYERLAALELSPDAPAVEHDMGVGPRQEIVSPPTRVRNVDASASIAHDDYCLLVDASGGAVAVTLPPVSSGRVVVVKKIDASGNAVTISGAANIDGGASVSTATQYASYTIISDGAAWWVI